MFVISRRALTLLSLTWLGTSAKSARATDSDDLSQLASDTNALMTQASSVHNTSGEFQNISPIPTDLPMSERSFLILQRLNDLSRFPAGSADASRIWATAAELLARLNQIDRRVPDLFNTVRAPAPKLEKLSADYISMFSNLVVNKNDYSKSLWYVTMLSNNRARYESVAARSGVPWYFIGIVHSLEASFNFHSHLHNGDPLSARTTHVPPARPVTWNPPNDWESSALDALSVDGFVGKANWDLPHILYRLEAFNGFGYRSKKININSPYLWNYSQYYTKGKFKSDNHFDQNIQSYQCGGAISLKGLIASGTTSL
jgi:lysozyme family protein